MVWTPGACSNDEKLHVWPGSRLCRCQGLYTKALSASNTTATPRLRATSGPGSLWLGLRIFVPGTGSKRSFKDTNLASGFQPRPSHWVLGQPLLIGGLMPGGDCCQRPLLR